MIMHVGQIRTVKKAGGSAEVDGGRGSLMDAMLF